jgi:hypothetical protein
MNTTKQTAITGEGSAPRVQLIKTIRSHVGYSRWLSEAEDDSWISRKQCAEIPSPYAYSPTKFVYRWNGKRVVAFETSHKVYQIFALPDSIPSFPTDAEAIEAYGT